MRGKVTVEKALKRGGSDPGFSAFNRPKAPGVAPAALVLGRAPLLFLHGEQRPVVNGASLCRRAIKVLSNKPHAAPHTSCPTRLYYVERRRVLVTLKGTT